MKKQIIIAAATLGTIVFGTTAVKAQEISKAADRSSATTTVTMTLTDILSVDLGADGSDVNFTYEKADDYNNDQTVNKPANLLVTSSKPFGVKVNAKQPTFDGKDKDIASSILYIKALKNETLNADGDEVQLGTSPVPLLSGGKQGSKMPVAISYTIKASDAQKLVTKQKGSYTVDVVYTVAAN